jgi:gamma-glutamyl-gamma-aminobutyrate hydrolase PuuD
MPPRPSEVRTRGAKAACGLPIVIPSLGELMDSADILDVVDGLIFTGSPSNIEPFHYNGRPVRRAPITTLCVMPPRCR